MALSVDEYVQAVRKLLPRGAAWQTEPGTRLSGLLRGFAEELVRVGVRALTLIEESDPRTTVEMLADYERVYGLPDPCVGEEQTTPQRRASLLQKITSVGGQTPAYYISVAAVLGFTVTITEFSAHTVEHDVEHPIYDIQWTFAWQVNAPLNTVGHITVEDSVEDAISWFGNEQLECVLERIRPAHTVLIVAYS